MNLTLLRLSRFITKLKIKIFLKCTDLHLQRKRRMVIRNYSKLIPKFHSSLHMHRESLLQLQKIEQNIELANIKAKLTDYTSIKTEINFSGFLNYSMLELAIACRSLLTSGSLFEKKCVLKNAYLIIYETLNSYKIHNMELHRLITQKYPEFIGHFLGVSKKLKKFKKDHDLSYIEFVRNKIGGHIDGKFSDYYDVINGLNAQNSIAMVLDFIALLTALKDLSGAIVHKSHATITNDLKSFFEKTDDELKTSMS